MHARFSTLILAAALALAATESAWAVGRFVYVDGNVQVRSAAGVARAVRAGDQINERETVLVGEGRAQMRFDDSGWIALQPRTVFEVKQHESREDGNTLFSLLKGSLRAVTGILTDRRPGRYRMETPTATIGIRGTSFVVTYCAASCNLPDGLYVTGGDGTIFVRNGFGEIDLSRGRTAYVATANTPPRESDVKPVAEFTQTVTTQTVSAASSVSAGELRPGNFLYSSGTGGFVEPFELRNVTSFGLAGAISGTVSGQASGVFNGVFESGSGSSLPGADAGGGASGTITGGTLTVAFDALQRPFNVTIQASDGARVSATALNVPEIAQNDGILFWGRWVNATFNFDLQDPTHDGGPATVNASATVNGYLHYLIGMPSASVPVSGTATYSLVGGAGSTSQAGTVGSGIVSGSLIANFGANSVSTSGITVSHGGIYTVSGGVAGLSLKDGHRASFGTGNLPGITGTASGPTGSHKFEYSGFFAGAGAPTAPSRAGIGWIINRPDPIVGVSGFRCTSGC